MGQPDADYGHTDSHALLRAVIRLETKVDLMLDQQKETRSDIAELDTRVRAVETKVARLEADRHGRKHWPNIMTAVAGVVAVTLSVIIALTR